jgi:outer membrane protein assembly factor BamB
MATIVVARDAAAAPVWRQPGFSSTHGGYNPRETTIDPSNVATRVERWRVTGLVAEGSAVVADGRVFLATGTELIALSATDGSELWRKSLMPSPQCCSIYDPVLTPDGKVTTRIGWLGGVGSAKFDPATGEFTYDLPFHSGERSPTIYGEDVLSVTFAWGSGGGVVTGLTPYPALISVANDASPKVRGPSVRGQLAFLTANSDLLTFDLSSCPNLSGNPNFPACTYARLTPLPAEPLGLPIAFRDRVAVGTADDTLRIFAAATGDPEWSAPIAAGIGQIPAISRRRIFVASKRGLMLAFDARGCGSATCSPVARFQLGSRASGQPVVAGRVVYAGTKSGHTVAFAERGCSNAKCTPLWDEDVGTGAIVVGPIVIDGLVIVGTADGQVVAYGLP